MQFLKQHKGKILAIIVFLIAIFVYKFMFSSNEDVSGENVVNAQSVGTDIIALNASIDRIDLDSPLFSSRPFKNLIDFSVEIPQQPIGRSNPFDLIGR